MSMGCVEREAASSVVAKPAHPRETETSRRWYNLCSNQRRRDVTRSFTVVVERDAESGWLVGEVVEQPGCHTQAPDLPGLESGIREPNFHQPRDAALEHFQLWRDAMTASRKKNRTDP